MGKFVTICTLLMGGAILACNWLYPESVIAWFAAPGDSFTYVRSAVLTLVAAIVVLEAYADNIYVRRLAGLVGLAFMYGTVQFWVAHPVYMFDALFFMGVAISFGLLGLQVAGEQRELPPVPVAVKRVPVRVQAVTMFDRLQDLQYRKQRSARQFSPVMHLDDIDDDSHRLIVNVGSHGGFRGGGAAMA